MAVTSSAGFLVFTCNEGSEDFLKREIAQRAPQALRLGYSKKRFLSYKYGIGAKLPSLDADDWVFARTIGVFLEKTKDLPVAELAVRVEQRRESRGLKAVWRISEEASAGAALAPGERALQVLDLGKGEVFFAETTAGARGLPAPEAPEGAAGAPARPKPPSRAYDKLKQALAYFPEQPKAGELAVEVGSAPGGACAALLELGLEVVGIDRGEMAESVARHPRFTGVATSANDVPERFFPTLRKTDWAFLDIHAEPRIAIRELFKLLGRTEAAPKGMVLTLKIGALARWEEHDYWLGTIRKVHPDATVVFKQLPAHHQEIAAIVFAATPGGAGLAASAGAVKGPGVRSARLRRLVPRFSYS